MQEISLLFDLDGTICNTQPVFNKWHGEAKRFLAGVIGLTQKEADDVFSRVWNQGYRKYYVNPDNLINHTCTGLSTLYPVLGKKETEVVRDMLYGVYDEPVEKYPDADETMRGLCVLGILIGVVTHAPDWWTEKKLDWIDIRKYLKGGSAYVVDMNGPKYHRSWTLAAKEKYGFVKSHSWVAGDSLEGDANAGIKARFCRSYWLQRPGENPWVVFGEGKLSRGVRKIPGLTQILDDAREWVAR